VDLSVIDQGQFLSPCSPLLRLAGADEEVVDGDVDEFDEEAHGAHDQEAHARRLQDSHVLCKQVGREGGEDAWQMVRKVRTR
jgi:hypothetical protein